MDDWVSGSDVGDTCNVASGFVLAFGHGIWDFSVFEWDLGDPGYACFVSCLFDVG